MSFCFFFSLQKGIQIINQLEDVKFEPFLKRITTKLRLQESEVFTEEEKNKLQAVFKIDEETLLIAIKTVIYVYKRLSKFLFMPNDLHNDLLDTGFNKEKAEHFVKVWSVDISSTLDDLVSSASNKYDSNPNFTWKLNTELSSDIQKKSNVPKAYLLISNNSNGQELELTHSDLYTMFIHLESIQNELDNVVNV